MNSYSESYKDAGVDITAGYRAVALMQSHIARTATRGVLGGVGGFGGLFLPPLSGMSEPVLVAGTDGVGTKLKLAFLTGRHDTIGIDAVAMCVNDIICCGAKPLFFLDYIACAKNEPERTASIVSGVADGCVAAGCALIGGETAEHPGMMPKDEYDIAGFALGIVDKKEILDKNAVAAGCSVVGIASSGLHSNGFSLIRQVFDVENADLAATVPALGASLADALLTPTRIYVQPVLALLQSGAAVRGISHITGGGLYENIPRCLPDGLSAKIEKSALDIPPIFRLTQERGGIPERDMFNTFNMGVGMVVITEKSEAGGVVAFLESRGEKAAVIGETVPSGEGVILW